MKMSGPDDTETVKHIRNKVKRQEVYDRIKKQKSEIKKAKKAQRKKEASEQKPKKVPKTLENTRVPDETVVVSDDEEVARDEEEDEFRAYFDGEQVLFLLSSFQQIWHGPMTVSRSTAEDNHHYQRPSVKKNNQFREVCIPLAPGGW